MLPGNWFEVSGRNPWLPECWMNWNIVAQLSSGHPGVLTYLLFSPPSPPPILSSIARFTRQHPSPTPSVSPYTRVLSSIIQRLTNSPTKQQHSSSKALIEVWPYLFFQGKNAFFNRKCKCKRNLMLWNYCIVFIFIQLRNMWSKEVKWGKAPICSDWVEEVSRASEQSKWAEQVSRASE